MNREWIFAAMAAMGIHALLFFGFRMETAAIPLPAADEPIDVSLVAAAPAPPPAAPPEPPPPEPVPAPPIVTPPPPPPPEPAPAPPPAPAEMVRTKPMEHPPLHAPAKPSQAAPTAPKMAASGPLLAGARTGATTAVRERSNPKPPYPAEARRLREQGRVLLEVRVSAEGRPVAVSVKRSSGFPVLDQAAVECVQRWTFEPARVGGLPTASRAEVPVTFSLTE